MVQKRENAPEKAKSQRENARRKMMNNASNYPRRLYSFTRRGPTNPTSKSFKQLIWVDPIDVQH